MSDERESPTYFGAPPRALATGAGLAARAGARLRMLGGFAARLVRAWLTAVRELASLRITRHRLDRSRRALQYELGGAALTGDEHLVADLRTRLQACIAEKERTERDAKAVLARARSRTSEERSAIAPTEIRRADRVGDPGFEPGTSALSERRSNQLS